MSYCLSAYNHGLNYFVAFFQAFLAMKSLITVCAFLLKVSGILHDTTHTKGINQIK